MKRILILSIALLLLAGCAGKTPPSGDPAALSSPSPAPLPQTDSDSFTVKDGDTSVETPDGVVFDFGCLFEAGEDITVGKVTPDTPDSDVDIYAYDFAVSSGQPEGVVEIVIPYDDADVSGDEEQLSVGGKYYNEQSGAWEDALYWVDTEANTVHILTDHLSTYGAWVVRNPGKRNEHLSTSFGAYITTQQADALLNIYAADSATVAEDVASSFFEATGSLQYFTATNVPALISLGGTYDDFITEQFSDSLTKFGIAVACSQFAFDMYYNGIRSEKTYTSAMKLTLNLAITKATAAIQLAYVGVGILDLALSEVSSYAIEQRYENTKNMYDAYYKRDGVRRGTKEWRLLFDKIYKDNKENPRQVADLISAEIDRYVNEYWEVAGTDWESWVDSYDENAALTKYPWPLSEDRENIANHYKAELYSSLQAVFNILERTMYYDCLAERDKLLRDIVQILNTVYAINIEEEEPEVGEAPQYADAYVTLSPLSDATTEAAWTVQLNGSGHGRLPFTLLAHESAGFPMELSIFKTEKDLRDKKPAYTTTLEPFTSTEKTVTLAALKTEAIDYSGVYIGTLYNTTTGTEIEMTTTITFDREYGDGVFYNIRGVDGTISPITGEERFYFGGSYFIRSSTGEVTMSTADFKFSADGLSFTANMTDYNGNVWGIITGSR